MNTKGKIDFTKTDNIQFIEEVAREISKEDRDWQWEARKIKQHSLLLWWELLEGSGQEGFRIQRGNERQHDCCYADTSENRHKIFSRLHSASIRNQIREGAFEVREQ